MLNDAQRKLVEDNLKLCHFMLHKMGIRGKYYEDCFQIACIGLCKAAANYQEEKSKFSSYATICIRNALAQEWQKEKRWEKANAVSLNSPVKITDGEVELLDLLPSLRTASESVAQQEIWRAVETLPPRWRDVVILSAQGMTQQEIGDRLGVTRQAITQCLIKSREKIAGKLYMEG